MRIIRTLMVAIYLLMSSHSANAADKIVDTLVHFELPTAPLTKFQRSRKATPSGNLQQGIFTARLRLFPGKRKSPAAVVVHTCHNDGHYEPWLNRLNSWGFATLSFSRCQPPDHLPDDTQYPSLDWKRGTLAAFGALKFLSSKPEIDPNAIIVIAWSRLGMIPLSTINPEGFSQFFEERFAAAVGLYPFCSFARGPHAAPILILSAEKDDYVDTQICVRMGKNTSSDKYPVRVVVVPDAYHGFDIKAFGKPHRADRDEINPDGFAAAGGTLGYSPFGARRAIFEVHKFLQQYVLR